MISIMPSIIQVSIPNITTHIDDIMFVVLFGIAGLLFIVLMIEVMRRA